MYERVDCCNSQLLCNVSDQLSILHFFRYTERNRKKNYEINFVLVQREGLYHGAVITQYSQDGTDRRVRIFQKFHDLAQQNDYFSSEIEKKNKQKQMRFIPDDSD
jgi:hypothetical protein